MLIERQKYKSFGSIKNTPKPTLIPLFIWAEGTNMRWVTVEVYKMKSEM